MSASEVRWWLQGVAGVFLGLSIAFAGALVDKPGFIPAFFNLSWSFFLTYHVLMYFRSLIHYPLDM
jgi:hypothetical protein